jgi:hypothetical protein
MDQELIFKKLKFKFKINRKKKKKKKKKKKLKPKAWTHASTKSIACGLIYDFLTFHFIV